MSVSRLRIPEKKVEEVDQGRAEVTLLVTHGLVDFSDVSQLKAIKKLVRGANGKIEPIPTPKNPSKNSSAPYFLPQCESTDDDM